MYGSRQLLRCTAIIGTKAMHWANLERGVVAALWLSAVGFACAAFNRRADMGSVTDADGAARSYAGPGPCRIASRRNIRLQGTTTAQHAAHGATSAAAHNFTVQLTVTRPISGGDADRQAPYPVVIFMNGFQVKS